MSSTKKGLLISPEFPVNAFWGYKNVLKRYTGKRTTFPPLGLITFAAMMPQEDWDFELLDLNVRVPRDKTLHRKIEEADIVFAGAMNIQRPSLVELLEGPAQGTPTPWFLGGPMASTYRDTILDPRTPSDQVLHDGLDYLVWGEAQPWIPQIVEVIEQDSSHSESTPKIFIPERVATEPSGSRDYLWDQSIFKPLDTIPLPRWDLINPKNYKSMMFQATAGCKFRCDFCDIVQFNGGFARVKDKAMVQRELQAIYDTGFRGNVFQVDDNFVSKPEAMENILEGIIEFQRDRGYPFYFVTQASVDLGKDENSHLIPLMAQAGFSAIFLGIENPNPHALQQVNKTQNVKNSIEDTIRQIQEEGMEIQGGFIYGIDGDEKETANVLVDFINRTAIATPMVGILQLMPHTPLHRTYMEEGRLVGDGTSVTNNSARELQFTPLRPQEGFPGGFEEGENEKDFHDGYDIIMERLFNKEAIYERTQAVLEKVKSHIFYRTHTDWDNLVSSTRSVIVSLARQGLDLKNGIVDKDYLHLLKGAVQQDWGLSSETRDERKGLSSFWEDMASYPGDPIELDEEKSHRLGAWLNYARDGLVRHSPHISLGEIRDIIGRVGDSTSAGQVYLADAQHFYQGVSSYLDTRLRLFRFPGANLIKAFKLTIQGEHYETIAANMLSDRT